MNSKFKKIVSVLLILTLFFTTQLTSFAEVSSNNCETTILELNDKLGVVRIDYEDRENGSIIFKQYLNNKLTDMVELKKGSDIITQTSYTNSEQKSWFNSLFPRESKSVETYRISDYIEKINVNEAQSRLMTSGFEKLGRINYKALDGTEGILKYSLDVFCETTPVGATTYDIKGFNGTLVSLVAILVGAINIPIEAIVSKYIGRLLVAAGISVVSGVLSAALTTTVSAVQTDYDMKLVNTRYSYITKHVEGHKYYVIDHRYYTGETYYDGYVPNDWGKQLLGMNLHNEMFTYSNFSIESWN